MKTIAHKLWTEPTYFVMAFVMVGELGLHIVSLPDEIELPLAAFLVALGAKLVRDRVTPSHG